MDERRPVRSAEGRLPRSRESAGGWLADAPRLVALSVLGLVILAPYIWMLSASLKATDEIFRANLTLIPERWAAIENYSRVFAQVPVGRYLLNGLIVCGGILVFHLLFAIPAG